MWVRGLKHRETGHDTLLFESHPMWVRGLKQNPVRVAVLGALVAPYVGAWIETFATSCALIPG